MLNICRWNYIWNLFPNNREKASEWEEMEQNWSWVTNCCSQVMGTWGLYNLSMFFCLRFSIIKRCLHTFITHTSRMHTRTNTPTLYIFFSRLTFLNYLFFHLCIFVLLPTRPLSLSPIPFPHSKENDLFSKMQNTVVPMTFDDFSLPVGKISKFLALDHRGLCDWFLLISPEYLLLLSSILIQSKSYAPSCGSLSPRTFFNKSPLTWLTSTYSPISPEVLLFFTKLPWKTPTFPSSQHLYPPQCSTYYTIRQVLLLICVICNCLT